MESIDVSNRGKRWSETDSERLKTLYCADKWSLVPLAQEFKRTPCSIWSRLVQYNIIAEAEQVRGYDEYLDKYAESYAATPPPQQEKRTTPRRIERRYSQSTKGRPRSQISSFARIVVDRN